MGMKEKVIEAVGNQLDDLHLLIDDVYVEKVEGEQNLVIVLDREEIIPIQDVVSATKILNPIVDQLNLVEGTYILDIYAKPKGDGNE